MTSCHTSAVAVVVWRQMDMVAERCKRMVAVTVGGSAVNLDAHVTPVSTATVARLCMLQEYSAQCQAQEDALQSSTKCSNE